MGDAYLSVSLVSAYVYSETSFNRGLHKSSQILYHGLKRGLWQQVTALCVWLQIDPLTGNQVVRIVSVACPSGYGCLNYQYEYAWLVAVSQNYGSGEPILIIENQSLPIMLMEID